MKIKFLATVIVTWEVVKNVLVPCNFIYNQWTQVNEASSFCSQQIVTEYSQEFTDPDPLVAQALADNFIGTKPHGASNFTINNAMSSLVSTGVELE